jgi:predicted transposase YbfD/YdcC
MDRFYECFENVPDPRADNCSHVLLEVLFIALLASLCGAKGCAAMAEFGRAKEELLGSILTLKHGIPSHDTFSAVFRMLDPKAFETAFLKFMASFGAAAGVGKTTGVVAVDGKALRRAYEAGQSHMPKVMVSLWAAQTRMTLATMLAPKNNEADAALQLVQLVALKGCVVTADALHCHRAMAKAVVESGGDSILAVKNNQPSLLAEAKALIAEAEAKDAERAHTADARHGRKEQRTAIVAPAKHMAVKHDFAQLQAVAKITSRRGQEKPVERYFLLSRRYQPNEFLRHARSHWDIENELHWRLDVVLDEDLARNRKDYGPQNLAVLRRMVLNVARAHPNTKTSLNLKLMRAAWDEDFLFDLIRHMR